MNLPILLMLTSVAALLAGATPAVAAPNAAQLIGDSDVYQAFNAYCLEYFGAEHEPLVYEKFGDELTELQDSHWLHASERSAAIAWSTSLPARTVVEYGPTAELGSSTEDDQERPFYTHIKYLGDLEPDQTYHYRLVGVDERGNRVASAVRTFDTGAPAGVTRIDALPGGGEPYRITAPGYYLVTADLVADHRAFDIQSGDVTLDLGGHTITYNNREAPEPEGTFWDWQEQSPQGVIVSPRNSKNVNILNGTIIQGKGNNGAHDVGRGANPILVMSGATGKIAGVTIVWAGEQVRGMVLMSEDVEVHHSVAVDLGTEVSNRHQGLHAIGGITSVHHNLVKRTRHRGITTTSNGEAARNEVYVDAWTTNAFGIYTYKAADVVIRDNRVFGGGYLPVGLAPLSAGTENIEVFDNFVHMQATRPTDRWPEYGEQSSVAGFRSTWGGVNIQVHHNTIIANARDGGMARAIWFSNKHGFKDNVVRDNVIKSVVDDDPEGSDNRGTIAINGSDADKDVDLVLFENNRVITNYLHIRFGDDYGTGHAARFVNNTFERVGDLDRYRFVQIGYWRFHCINNRLVDATFVGDVSHDMVRWDGGREDAPRWFEVAWTFGLETSPGAAVTITDAAGEIVAEGKADAEGLFQAELVEARYEDESVTRLTPHAVTVEGETRKVEVDRPLTAAWAALR
ncbi:MAG: hypothetical protein WD118_11755 [Phycisphaeraceae bacterium]